MYLKCLLCLNTTTFPTRKKGTRAPLVNSVANGGITKQKRRGAEYYQYQGRGVEEENTQNASGKRVKLLSHLHQEKWKETHCAKKQTTTSSETTEPEKAKNKKMRNYLRPQPGRVTTVEPNPSIPKTS